MNNDLQKRKITRPFRTTFVKKYRARQFCCRYHNSELDEESQSDRKQRIKLQFLAALNNPKRLKIIETLAKNSLLVRDIVKQTGIEQSLVSHHLRELEKSHIVQGIEYSKFVYYMLNTETVIPILDMIDEHIEQNIRY